MSTSDKVEAEVWIAGLKALIPGMGGRSKIDGWSDGLSIADSRDLTLGSPTNSSVRPSRDLNILETPYGSTAFPNSFRTGNSVSSERSHVASDTPNMLVRGPGSDVFRVSVSSAQSSSSHGSVPDDCDALGDVYVWGEVLCDNVSKVGADANASFVCSKSDVLVPRPLESNVVLDVHHIACGVKHAALVSRQGEVFTWGEGSGGCNWLAETEVKKEVSELDGDPYGLTNFHSKSYSPGISESTGLSEWSKETVRHAKSQNVSSDKIEDTLDTNESEDDKKPLSSFIGSWVNRGKNRENSFLNTAYSIRLDSSGEGILLVKEFLLVLVFISCFFTLLSAEGGPGFVSLDCGGDKPFTDELGLKWSPDHLTYGQAATISTPTKAQYMTLRHFPADSRKYCYSLNVTSSNRYLVRASFLYGNFDSKNVYPNFSIYIGSTHWATIVISEASKVERAELVFLASTSSVSVCLSNATSGQPFISTLELRQLGRSMYYTAFEKRFYMTVVARINFGAESEDSVRYPHDPFDRIWESDLLAKAKYLVDDSVGTVRVSTTLPIENGNSTRENPPQKVMQTAVVGTNGSLAYRINLDGFPSSCWAYMYFAEIEDLADDELRKFRLVIADQPEDGRPMVNMKKTVQRPYRVFEFGYPNITLPLVFKFGFVKTVDSSKGPILNAMEIIKHLPISDGPVDLTKKKGGDDDLTKPKGGDKTGLIIGVLVCVTILTLAAICCCICIICKCKQTSEPSVATSSSYVEEVPTSSSSYVGELPTSSSSEATAFSMTIHGPIHGR